MVISEKMLSSVNSLVGEFDIIKDHRNNSNRTGVLEISADNQRMFIKVYNRLNRWSPEVYAYKNWTHIFKEYAPKLLHTFFVDDTYGIITTPIYGKTINEYQIIDENVLEIAYYKAGELLRQLHDSFEGTYFGIPAVDGSPLEKNVETNPVYYINSSLEGILKSGFDKGLLDNTDKKLVEWCMKNSDVFTDSKPVPTNWDYSQNNWMVDENGKFTGLIDFENMLWGIDVDSFGVVIERYTQDKPRLRRVLFEGYGLENSLEKQLQLKIVSVKIAIADITYGASIGDYRYFALGRKLIDSFYAVKYLAKSDVFANKDTVVEELQAIELSKQELLENGFLNTDSLFEPIRYKDGILVCRGNNSNGSFVSKYFVSEKDKREITNYDLLNSINVPTIGLLGRTRNSIILEDINQSPKYRLGSPDDLGNIKVARLIAKWYKALHEHGKSIPGLSGLYRETDTINIQSLHMLREESKVESPVWNLLLENLSCIKDKIETCGKTITYNDFYWTNLVVTKDLSEALMFDYNLLGCGYRYGDIRNVCSSLSDDAQIAFLKEYGQFDEKEILVDECVSLLVSLIAAFKRNTFPSWGNEPLKMLKNGQLLKKVQCLIHHP